jgi:hypothetical protein
MKAEKPSMAVHMAKLDGRYAGEAWYIPGLETRAIKKNTATRGWRDLEIVE